MEGLGSLSEAQFPLACTASWTIVAAEHRLLFAAARALASFPGNGPSLIDMSRLEGIWRRDVSLGAPSLWLTGCPLPTRLETRTKESNMCASLEGGPHPQAQ